jgi:hypothetical protein
MVKVNINLTIEEEIIKKGKDLGLNISKVCENALVDMIGRIEGSGSRDNPSFSASAFSKRAGGASGGIRTRDQQLTRLPLRPG